MITYEQNLSHTVDVLFRDFSEILNPFISLVFLKLFWLENRRLKVKGTTQELIDMMELPKDTSESLIIDTLKTLKEAGLIEAKRNESGTIIISLNMLKRIDADTQKKMEILDRLLEKSLISPEAHKEAVVKISAKIERDREKSSEQNIQSKLEDVNFDKPKPPRKVNPDSAPELVKFYYRLMHEIFGGKYESPNILKEAHLLKLEMEKHGDSAENTRKFFAFILNAAKEKNAFDRVSNLSLYSRLRPTAYQKLIVENGDKYSKFVTYESKPDTGDDIMNSMKEVYDYLVKKGTSDSEMIKSEMARLFSDEQVNDFFKSAK